MDWDEEPRPGQGYSLSAIYLYGGYVVQIMLNVYGQGSVRVAETMWVHDSDDEGCPCEYCELERRQLMKRQKEFDKKKWWHAWPRWRSLHERRRPVKRKKTFDKEKVVAALQSDNPGGVLRGWAAVLNQLEMDTPKGEKTNDMVVERLRQDADRFDDLEEGITKIAALAWDEGVATALNFARRDPNGITLSLPNHSNPYRKGGQPMSHYLQIGEDLEVTFHCDNPPNAPCRRRPPKWVEDEGDSYTDEEATEPGHKCWAVDWVEAIGMDDAIVASTVLGRIPVSLSFEDGVVLEPVEAMAATFPGSVKAP